MPKSTIALCPCDSTRIHAHGFDPATGILALQFKAKGGAPGHVYHYSGVTPEVYAELQAAPSLGKFFGERINAKDDAGALKYPFTKMVPDEAAPA
ncbi:MAG: hypothetical protein A3E01_08460 [Gammaproteobacteria bacterium RIFCSPHIGHO2_12_FULL_63_22]|nr:MAG: hypothetical protein A3E01_08460 [Gammaproteobacteria bacterium RIFCSPHIGHO2_12_FULL_63_22]